MQINSIQVIRRGQLVTPQSVAGNRVPTISHSPRTVPGVVVGEQVEVNIFDTLRVNVSFDYRGPAQTITLYGAVGSRGVVTFDEYFYGEASVALPDSAGELVTVTATVDIVINPVTAGTYDLYVKIKEYPEAGMPEVDDVIVILEYYEEIQHTIYPWAYTYEGDAEVCTFDFKWLPEQIPEGMWLGDVIVDTFVSGLEQEGSRLLDLKVSRDTTPVLWTNYRVEVEATVPGEGVAGIAAPLPWGAIILGVLAILFVVAVVWAIKTIDKIFFHRQPLAEETKRQFTRTTLIQMILDLEPETPPPTLEEMTDEELRDHLNEILAPAPTLGWGIVGLAVAGGLGVVAVGAALAFARKE